MDPNFNLAMSDAVKGALDAKCERVNQLEEYAEEVKQQAENEVEELKQMVQTIGNENLRLKELLKEHQIEY